MHNIHVSEYTESVRRRCTEGGERKLGKSCGIYRQGFTLRVMSDAEDEKEGHPAKRQIRYTSWRRNSASILSSDSRYIQHVLLVATSKAVNRPRSMQQLLDTLYPASRGLNVKQVPDFR